MQTNESGARAYVEYCYQVLYNHDVNVQYPWDSRISYGCIQMQSMEHGVVNNTVDKIGDNTVDNIVNEIVNDIVDNIADNIVDYILGCPYAYIDMHKYSKPWKVWAIGPKRKESKRPLAASTH